MGRYSRFPEQMKRTRKLLALSRQTWPDRSQTDITSGRRVSWRLSSVDLEGLVADYKAGMTSRQLALQYGLARSTVVGLLREHGASVRHPRVSAADCARAVELNQSGVSQVEIARMVGRSPSVIWHVLERAGVIGTRI